jgi:oxygen-independent coproporphyrinogen-3 oxidase
MELDPGTFDKQKLKEFKEIGLNRASMGLQTFNQQEFNSLGRGHSHE